MSTNVKIVRLKFRIRKIEKEDPDNKEELAKLQSELHELEKLLKGETGASDESPEDQPKASPKQHQEPTSANNNNNSNTVSPSSTQTVNNSELKTSILIKEAQIEEIRRQIALKETEIKYFETAIKQSKGDEFNTQQLKLFSNLLDQAKDSKDIEISFPSILSSTADITKNELIDISAQLQSFPKQDSKELSNLETQRKEKKEKLGNLTNQLLDIVKDKEKANTLINEINEAINKKEESKKEKEIVKKNNYLKAISERKVAENLGEEKIRIEKENYEIALRAEIKRLAEEEERQKRIQEEELERKRKEEEEIERLENEARAEKLAAERAIAEERERKRKAEEEELERLENEMKANEQRVIASRLAAEKAAEERREAERKKQEKLKAEKKIEDERNKAQKLQQLQEEMIASGFKMCPNCNTKNEMNDKHCFKCSKYIPNASLQKRVTDNTPECSVCYSKISPDDDVCPDCGEPIVKNTKTCQTCFKICSKEEKFCADCGSQFEIIQNNDAELDIDESERNRSKEGIDPSLLTTRTCSQCFSRSAFDATNCETCDAEFKAFVIMERARCCLICFTQNLTSICHECGYEFQTNEEENNCPDCFAQLDSEETICKDCGYDKNAIKDKSRSNDEPSDLPDLNMKESIEKRKAEAEKARQAVLVAARERYNMIRANEKVRSLEQSLNEQKEIALAKRKREEEESRAKNDAIKQQEIDAIDLLKDNIAKRKAEAQAKKQKDEEEAKLKRQIQLEEAKKAEEELKKQRAQAAEKAREDRKQAEEAKRLWEIEKKEIERRTMIEKAKQDKLNQQRLREERERLMKQNELLSPRSQRPLPNMRNYYVCACGFQNEDTIKFCESCGNAQPQLVKPLSIPTNITIQTNKPITPRLQLPQIQCTMFCGFMNDLGKKFCESCGAKVDQPIKCKSSSCGSLNEPTRKFCEDCGAKLGEDKITCDCGFENLASCKFCENCGAKTINQSPENTIPESDEFLICTCGHKNEGSRKFCEECGSKIIQQIICSECNHSNDKDRVFCGGCGSKLQQPEQQTQQPQQQKDDEEEERMRQEQQLQQQQKEAEEEEEKRMRQEQQQKEAEEEKRIKELQQKEKEEEEERIKQDQQQKEAEEEEKRIKELQQKEKEEEERIKQAQQQQQQQTNTGKVCSYCDEKNEPDRLFCHECGTKL